MDNFIQLWLMLFSGLAIWLIGRVEHWKRWGYIAGLISQPAWIYTAIESKQWGVILLCIWYTYSWLQGIYNYWIKNK